MCHAQVVEAVCRALLLDPHERAHVSDLGRPGRPLPLPPRAFLSLSPAVQVMLDQLSPLPGTVSNLKFDLLAYNATYARLLLDPTATRVEERKRAVAGLHRSAMACSVLVEWEDSMSRLVAQFRLNMADHMGEPAWKADPGASAVRRRSPDFVRMWGAS